MLELAAAAFGEVAAWRLLVMRAGCERAVVEQGVARHAEGTCRPLSVTPSPRAAMRTIELVHRGGERLGIAAARSSAIICGPGDLRGTTVQPDACTGRLERRQTASTHRRDDSGKDVTGTRTGQPCRRRRRKAQPAIGRRDQGVRALCKPPRRPLAEPLQAPALACCRAACRTGVRNSPSCGVMMASWPFSRSGSPRCVIPSASITLGARDVSASVSTCGMSPMPGPTSRQPMRSSLTWRSPSGRSRRAGLRSAATCLPGHSPRRSVPRPLRQAQWRRASCPPAHGPARAYICARRGRAAGLRRARSRARRVRLDPDVGEDDPPALVHRRMSRCAGFERTERHGQIECGHLSRARRRCRSRLRSGGRRQPGPPTDRTDLINRPETVSSRPRFNPVPNNASISIGAGAVFFVNCASTVPVHRPRAE